MNTPAKLFILQGIALLHSLSSFEQPAYKVNYKHWFQRDTTKSLSSTFIRDATLIGNSEKSIYIYNVGTAKLKDTVKVDYRNFQELINDVNAGKVSGTQNINIKNGIPFDEFGNQVFYDKKSDSGYSRIKMSSQYVLVAEKNQSVNWKLIEEEKKIQVFNCKKATGQYRGRTYIAWFSPEIPIPEGP